MGLFASCSSSSKQGRKQQKVRQSLASKVCLNPKPVESLTDVNEVGIYSVTLYVPRRILFFKLEYGYCSFFLAFQTILAHFHI